jgi:hypothetical protein
MNLRAVLDELGVCDFVYVSRELTGGRLWCCLQHVVEQHGEDVDLDLQLEIADGAATVMVRAVRGEGLLTENSLHLGPVLGLPQRGRVLVELWRLVQEKRARARWVAGTNRKLRRLGLRPIDPPVER